MQTPAAQDSGARPPLQDCCVQDVADYIATGQARRIVVMLGAGVSVSAGIPDFRTPGSGLYANLQKFNLPNPEAICELSFFKKNPAPFYQLMKDLWPGQYRPTPAHYFVRLLHEKGLLLRCFTQNIDSLETRAGIPAEQLVAAHGNFDTARCIKTGRSVPIAELEEAVMNGTWQELRQKYRGLVKPDVVLFGEKLPHRFEQCRRRDAPQADLLLVMGTSLQVEPFASLMHDVRSDVPRLLLNRELVGRRDSKGRLGFRFEADDNERDVAMLTECDNGVLVLATLLGWQDELATLMEGAGHRWIPPTDLPRLALWPWSSTLQYVVSGGDSDPFCIARLLPATAQVRVRWRSASAWSCIGGAWLVNSQATPLCNREAKPEPEGKKKEECRAHVPETTPGRLFATAPNPEAVCGSVCLASLPHLPGSWHVELHSVDGVPLTILGPFSLPSDSLADAMDRLRLH
eukprot:GGOE01019610.1.p1 GENE.GGOE01019610.1~~GGOE01019610.1.p1  ORF type:complete len:460 (-),score=134.02 GGOE01019610.1:70-1449(-)